VVATLNSSNTPDNHVALIARFAFGAIEAASDTLIDEEDPDRGYVQIRWYVSPLLFACLLALSMETADWLILFNTPVFDTKTTVGFIVVPS